MTDLPRQLANPIMFIETSFDLQVIGSVVINETYNNNQIK